jgi:DNA-binding PadR family transcriptional regulator
MKEYIEEDFLKDFQKQIKKLPKNLKKKSTEFKEQSGPWFKSFTSIMGDRRLQLETRIMLCYLISKQERMGKYFYRGIQKMGKELGFLNPTVYRAIENLEKLGLITILMKEDGRHYRINKQRLLKRYTKLQKWMDPKGGSTAENQQGHSTAENRGAILPGRMGGHSTGENTRRVSSREIKEEEKQISSSNESSLSNTFLQIKEILTVYSKRFSWFILEKDFEKISSKLANFYDNHWNGKSGKVSGIKTFVMTCLYKLVATNMSKDEDKLRDLSPNFLSGHQVLTKDLKEFYNKHWDEITDKVSSFADIKENLGQSSED